MSNKIRLTLFLLKGEYSLENYKDVIKDDYDYDPYDLDPAVGIEGKICVGKNRETKPDWFDFLNEGSFNDNIFKII